MTKKTENLSITERAKKASLVFFEMLREGKFLTNEEQAILLRLLAEKLLTSEKIRDIEKRKLFYEEFFKIYEQELQKAKETLERLKKEKKEALRPTGKRKISIPKELHTIIDKVFKNQLTKKHYKGTKEIKNLKLVGQDEPVDLGLVAVWQTGDVEYFIRQTDLAKLKNQAPKVYVSQDKNIKLLLALVEQQQFTKEEKKAEASFTLKEYAMLRGYTEEEIKKGGKFIEELKRDLYAGAYTTFKVNEITIDGKKYIAHGLPNLYILLEPKNPNDKWIVKFNSFYAESILKALKGETKQYFTHQLKEIADRKTTEKPYLHFFYNQLIYRKQAGKNTIPKKVDNFLREMGIAEKVLKRPKECFRVLKECLVYISKNYPKELEGVIFYNDFNKDTEKQLPLSNLPSLENLNYNEFKEMLRAIGVKDIREAFISFVRPKETKKELLSLPNQQNNENLIDEIMEWLNKNINWGKMTKLNREATKQYLKDCLKYLGATRLNELFRQEAQATYPNAIKFLNQTLKNEMAQNKKKKEGLKSIAEILKNKWGNSNESFD